MIEVDVEVDPHATVSAAAMTRGVMFTVQAQGQKVVLHLDTEVAEQAHATLATALTRDCQPHPPSLGSEYSAVALMDPAWAARLAREARSA